jgi:hypothetical protein
VRRSDASLGASSALGRRGKRACRRCDGRRLVIVPCESANGLEGDDPFNAKAALRRGWAEALAPRPQPLTAGLDAGPRSDKATINSPADAAHHRAHPPPVTTRRSTSQTRRQHRRVTIESMEGDTGVLAIAFRTLTLAVPSRPGAALPFSPVRASACRAVHRTLGTETERLPRPAADCCFAQNGAVSGVRRLLWREGACLPGQSVTSRVGEARR